MNLISGSFIVAFFWACAALIQKYVLKTVKSNTILFISSVATILFAGLYCLYHKESIIDDFSNLNITLILWICVATFFSVIIANILYLELLKEHNSSIVTALTYSSPVLVLLISMILFKEKITLYSGIGVILVVCGTILVGISHDF